MKIVALPLLLSCFIIPALGQELLPAFGKPVMEELTLKECAFDKNASAMKLLDYQEKEVIVDYGLKIKTERRIKIKIFNEKGFRFANISIPYISRIKGTKITDINAYIHYIDSAGKVITEKVGKKQIFRDKADDAVKKISFTFPNVRPGCVIEYKYEKTEKNSLHLEPWYFQDFIPTLHSRFILTMPTMISMDRRVIGVDSIGQKLKSKPSSYSYPSLTERTYTLTNIQAFRPEPMMASVADNLQRIEFAVQPTGLGFAGFMLGDNKWRLYTRALNEIPSFGKQFHKPVPGTEALLDSAQKLKTKEEKISYIFQQVKQHVKWDEQQTFYAGDIADAWKERSGNSAEINLLILNLLRKTGIRCSPLLISTRDNGKVDKDFFSLSQFNGVNVLILDTAGNYILDGTRKHLSYKTTPENILNRQVLNADTANTDWLYVSDNRPLLKSLLSVDAILSEDGKLKGTAFIQFHDHSKVQRLAEKDKTDEEQREEEKEFLQKDFTELKIDSLVIENENNELEPLKEKFMFTYQPSVSDKFIFLDPLFLSSFRKNPFSDSLRQTSIDFGSRQYLKTTVNIELPESFEVDHIPKSIRLRMADSTILFERRVYHQDNRILFMNTMEVLYPLFDKEENPAIRDFFTRLYAMVTEQIILKRK